jgi:cytochrome P450
LRNEKHTTLLNTRLPLTLQTSCKSANLIAKWAKVDLETYRIAGSETTATTLSCATYYLLRNPEIHDKLRTEIRGAFSSYEEIDSASASKLKLVNAICLEAMRMYPPLPFALPRVVPPGGATVDGHMIPEGVS